MSGFKGRGVGGGGRVMVTIQKEKPGEDTSIKILYNCLKMLKKFPP